MEEANVIGDFGRVSHRFFRWGMQVPSAMLIHVQIELGFVSGVNSIEVERTRVNRS
jgi:hypothetical protein